MLVYDRKTGAVVEEQEYGEAALRFLYDTVPGRILLKLVVARPFFSRLRAIYQKSPVSKRDILPFIQKYSVDMTEYKDTYACFNDFFIRRRAIPRTAAAEELTSPADAKLLAYQITKDLRIRVKHGSYTLEEILKEPVDLTPFENGTCLVFRLSVSDCHRYYFMDDGEYVRRYHIKGLLHTVRPISARYRVFCSNQREVSLLDMRNLGSVIQVEVGALLVGCVRNHDAAQFSKLEEKGYFEYGGSTILVLVGSGIKIDEDILENSRLGVETKVTIGEKIGEFLI